MQSQEVHQGGQCTYMGVLIEGESSKSEAKSERQGWDLIEVNLTGFCVMLFLF